MSAKESVVNLAIPHCDEAKAIIDNCMEITIKDRMISEFILLFQLLIKNYCSDYI